ncbi:Hypothetical protein A7982_04026 [Minicystis rosea]|nr:Hypothetical protein A7982_04026 [Minicystis rosea]
MSIDLIVGERRQSSRVFNSASVSAAVESIAPRSVTDLVVVYGGWGASEGGQPLGTGGESTGTTQLVDRLKAIRSTQGHHVLVRAWQGSLRTGLAGAAEDFVRSAFHPLGKLIITGYSVGGFNAMALAQSLFYAGYYNVNRRTWQQYYSPSADRTREVVGIARVDLLVTIDAAQGYMSDANSRRVAPSVRKNINIFQTNPSGRDFGTGVALAPRSHGGPNTAMDEAATLVENRDWTSRYAGAPNEGHGSIDNDAIEATVAAVRAELGGH